MRNWLVVAVVVCVMMYADSYGNAQPLKGVTVVIDFGHGGGANNAIWTSNS